MAVRAQRPVKAVSPSIPRTKLMDLSAVGGIEIAFHWYSQATEPPEHPAWVSYMRDRFRVFSKYMAETLGSNRAFAVAVSVVLVWALSGPAFAFSDTWQLVINTGTTIVTFLMVFLIQNTQNREAMALQLKIDELLRAVAEARTSLVDLENRSDEEMEQVKQDLNAAAQSVDAVAEVAATLSPPIRSPM